MPNEITAPLKELAERITNYLTNGGFFNPEMMEHDKVRQLLIECRDAVTQIEAKIAEHSKAVEAAALRKAAGHYPIIGYCFSLYRLECSCGHIGSDTTSWKGVDKEKFQAAWEQHLSSLISPDSRTALDAHVQEKVAEGRVAEARIWARELNMNDPTHHRDHGQNIYAWCEECRENRIATLEEILAAARASAKVKGVSNGTTQDV